MNQGACCHGSQTDKGNVIPAQLNRTGSSVPCDLAIHNVTVESPLGFTPMMFACSLF